jgi:hypothetical protein
MKLVNVGNAPTTRFHAQPDRFIINFVEDSPSTSW